VQIRGGRFFRLSRISSQAVEKTPAVGEVGGVISDWRRGHSFVGGKWEICLEVILLGSVESGVSFEEMVTGYGEESMAQVVRVAGRTLGADAFEFGNSP